VSRGAGRSALQAAAYVARERYHDERLGETFNYRYGAEHAPLTEASPIAEAAQHIGDQLRHAEGGSRQEVLFSGLYAPEGAPDWTRGAENIERFWNAAEAAEKRRDAQIAERIIIALPKELTLEQNIWALQDHIREFTRQGRVVQVAIHSPEPKPGHDDRNLHAHLLVSTRGVNENGLKATKKQDQEERFLHRRDYVEHMRERWEHVANRHLARHGHEATLDHRSYQRQGIDREPELHLGPGDAERERQGKRTPASDHNHAVRERNAERERQRLDQVVEQRHAQTPRPATTQAAHAEPGIAEAHDRRREREEQRPEPKAPKAFEHAPGSFPAGMDAAAAWRALRATVEDIARELSPKYRHALETAADLEKELKAVERAQQSAVSAGKAAHNRQTARREAMGGLRRFIHDRGLWKDAELAKWQIEAKKAAYGENKQGVAVATVRDQLSSARWTVEAERDAIYDRAQAELRERQSAAIDQLPPRERLEVLRWADHKDAGLAPLDLADVAREISPAYRRAADAVTSIADELRRAEYSQRMAERDAMVARARTEVVQKGRPSKVDLVNAASKELGAEFTEQKHGLRVEAVREQLAGAEKRAGEEFEKARPEAEKELQSRVDIASYARQQLDRLEETERIEQRERQTHRPRLRM
jgi:MobA/MobL family protein